MERTYTDMEAEKMDSSWKTMGISIELQIKRQSKQPTERDPPFAPVILCWQSTSHGESLFLSVLIIFLLSVSTSKPGVSKPKESDGQYVRACWSYGLRHNYSAFLL